MDQFTELVNFMVYTIISLLKVIPELLSWPVIILIIALIYKHPISQLIQNLVELIPIPVKTKGPSQTSVDLEMLKASLEQNKIESEYYNKMAQAYSCRGNLEEARNQYTKSIKLDPENASAYIGLGNSFYRTGRFDEAIKALIRAVEIKPYWADARCNLGAAYSLAGFNENAVSEFLQAIEINPNYAAAIYGLGISYIALNQLDKAKELLDPLNKLDAFLAEKLSETIENQTSKK